jgi:hypothetical protein
MVQLDTRLPLGIQQPDFLNALAQGTQNAGNQAALMRQAEGQNLFRQHGAGAMQGDPSAMNALAGFDPVMAQGMDINRQENRRADQRIGIAQQQLQLAREAGQRAAMEAQDRRAAMQEAQQGQQMMRQLAQAFASGDERAFGAISAEIAGQPLPMEPQSLQTLDAFLSGFSGGLSSMVPQGPEPTSEMRNLEFRARQANLKPGSPEYREFMASGGRAGPLVDMSGMTIGGDTMGKPIGTQGLVMVPDPNAPGGLRAIAAEGSPLAEERARAAEAQQRADANATREDVQRSGVVQQTTKMIRELITKGGNRSLVDLPETGVIGERLNRWGVNQEAADMAGRIDTLKGMVAFDRLNALREASATGASGLGQVTEREIALLAAQLGALDQRLSPPVLLETLDTIDAVMGKLSPAAEAFITGAVDTLPSAAASAVGGFGAATLDELLAVDVMNLPADQLDDYERRLNELQGQR